MKTNFKIGDKVTITDGGCIYTTYEEMAERMNLTKWKRNPNFNSDSCNGNTGVIVSIQTCTYHDNILAGVDLGEEEIIINFIGLEQFKTLLKTPIMDIKKSIKISRHLLNDYYNASTIIQKQFINDNFKIDGTTTVESIIGLHNLACDTWKNTIKENHPECFPVTKTAIELAVEKAGKPDFSMCNVKIKRDLILVELPSANSQWSFAAFEWAMKFCKEYPQCYPIHKNENNNTDYLYIQWND